MAPPRPIFKWFIFAAAILNVVARDRPTTDPAPRLDSPCPLAMGLPPHKSLRFAPRSHSRSNSTSSSTSTSSSAASSTASSTATSTSTLPNSVRSSSSTHSTSTSHFPPTSIFPTTPVHTTSTATSNSIPISVQGTLVPCTISITSSLTCLTFLSPREDGGSSNQSMASGTSSSPQLSNNSTMVSEPSPSMGPNVSLILPTPPLSVSSPLPSDENATAQASMGSSPSVVPMTPAPSTAAQEQSSGSSHKLSTGGIIGAIVAVFGFFWLAALALWWLLRKWRASKVQGTRTGRPAWQLGTHRYEQADANEAPIYDTTAPDALQPASYHGFGDKEAMLLNSSPTPSSRPPTPLPDPSPLAEEGARCRSGSPATLVDRPPSLATSRPPSLKNTELLALAGTDYSVAVARARSRSSSAPQPCPNPTTSMAELHTAFGAELARTSTNPFRERMRAAEAARQNARPGGDEDRDWWAGQQA